MFEWFWEPVDCSLATEHERGAAFWNRSVGGMFIQLKILGLSTLYSQIIQYLTVNEIDLRRPLSADRHSCVWAAVRTAWPLSSSWVSESR
jgi:hypothetical protein